MAIFFSMMSTVWLGVAHSHLALVENIAGRSLGALAPLLSMWTSQCFVRLSKKGNVQQDQEAATQFLITKPQASLIKQVMKTAEILKRRCKIFEDIFNLLY